MILWRSWRIAAFTSKRPLRRHAPVGAGAFPVGAAVPGGPAGRFVTSARGVEDAAPYDRGAFRYVGAGRRGRRPLRRHAPVGAAVPGGPVGRFGMSARGVEDAAPSVGTPP